MPKTLEKSLDSSSIQTPNTVSLLSFREHSTSQLGLIQTRKDISTGVTNRITSVFRRDGRNIQHAGAEKFRYSAGKQRDRHRSIPNRTEAEFQATPSQLNSGPQAFRQCGPQNPIKLPRRVTTRAIQMVTPPPPQFNETILKQRDSLSLPRSGSPCCDELALVPQDRNAHSQLLTKSTRTIHFGSSGSAIRDVYG